jgi:large subunit ribosomal protein L25
MEKHELKATLRLQTGRKVKNLRRQGIIPANVFGKNIKSLNIQVDAKEFQKLFALIGESTLSYLNIQSEKSARPVFVGDVIKHPVSGNLLHVAFHQVDLKEKVTAHVPIKLVGESVAEKEKIGILVQQVDELEIEALPTDMPESIQVDVAGLSEVGAHILVKDLKLDTSKLHIKIEPDTIVIQIEALAKEEVAPAPVTPEVATVPGAEPAPIEGETPAPKSEPEAKVDKK